MMGSFDLDFDDLHLHEKYIEPVIRLWNGEGDMKENLRDLAPVLKETGRVFFQNKSITVILLPALIALLILLLGALLLKLFFGLTLMDVMDAMVGGFSQGTPYSTSGSGYAAPAPASSYGTPSAAGYDALDAETAGYSARSSYYDDENVELTPEQRSLYPELAKLQDDIERSRLNEMQLRGQLFVNNAAGSDDLASAASGQIGYYN